MKGLFIKDLRLMYGQKTFFLIVLGVSALCVLTGQNLIFMVSYCSFLVANMAIGTISYDDMGNGLAYIFTWPAGRRQYVIEKYALTGVAGTAAWLLAVIAGAVFPAGRPEGIGMADWFLVTTVVLGILLFSICVLIPLKLKFGAEKARLVSFLVMFAMFGGIGLLSVLDDNTLHQIKTSAAVLETLPPWVWAVFTVVMSVVAILVSICVSIRIAEKKEL